MTGGPGVDVHVDKTAVKVVKFVKYFRNALFKLREKSTHKLTACLTRPRAVVKACHIVQIVEYVDVNENFDSLRGRGRTHFTCDGSARQKASTAR